MRCCSKSLSEDAQYRHLQSPQNKNNKDIGVLPVKVKNIGLTICQCLLLISIYKLSIVNTLYLVNIYLIASADLKKNAQT